MLVVAIDDIEQNLQACALARAHFPHLHIVARARNVGHWYALRDLGITDVERETLDAALASGRSALQALGWHPHRAWQLASRFRRHTIEQLERQHPHHRDEARLTALAWQGRQQLEELFAQEREEARDTVRPPDWATPMAHDCEPAAPRERPGDPADAQTTR